MKITAKYLKQSFRKLNLVMYESIIYNNQVHLTMKISNYIMKHTKRLRENHVDICNTEKAFGKKLTNIFSW